MSRPADRTHSMAAAMSLAGQSPTDGSEDAPRRDAPWVVRRGEAQGLVSYVEAIRAGRWIIIGALVACLGAALIYLTQADKVYEANADLLITPQADLPVPVPGIIIQSSDPTRDVETVARLVTSPPVASRVKQKLDLEGTVTSVSKRIEVSPVA